MSMRGEIFPQVQPSFGKDACPRLILERKENDDEKQRVLRQLGKHINGV